MCEPPALHLSPRLLSGETRDTVDMMAGLAVLVERYLGRQSRAQVRLGVLSVVFVLAVVVTAIQGVAWQQLL